MLPDVMLTHSCELESVSDEQSNKIEMGVCLILWILSA